MMTSDLVARVGLKTRREDDPYFQNRQRLFSFQMSVVFFETFNGSDLDFGIRLLKPLNELPWGSSLAIAFIQVLYFTDIS